MNLSWIHNQWKWFSTVQSKYKAEKEFETDINESNKGNCEFFINNVHLDLRDDTEDNVLTYDNTEGIDREVLWPQQNMRPPNRLDMFPV